MERKAVALFACCGLMIGIAGCGSQETKSETVTEMSYSKQFDSEWPWEENEVKINCKGAGAFTISTSGREYYGNGTAKDRGLGADPREIWKDDPGIPGAKISSMDFTNMANDFCNAN